MTGIQVVSMQQNALLITRRTPHTCFYGFGKTLSPSWMLRRILLVFLPAIVQPVTIPPVLGNEILGQPQVSCDAQHIIFFANTSGPFGGNAYTKGFFSIPGCHVRGNITDSFIELAIPTSDKCGVRRKRMTGRKGLELEVTVVLMFHHIFLTKGDRSFNLKCVYAEIETQVTRNIDVSTLPPQDLPTLEIQQDEQHQPNCGYDVLSGGPRGEPVRFATIGDAVYHRWHCETGRNTEFCMTVHSCTADDGQGWTQELIDSDGCTLDSFLLANLEQDGELSMGQRSQVFKFADRPTVYFNCMIKLKPKSTTDACLQPNDYCGKPKEERQLEQEITQEVNEVEAASVYDEGIEDEKSFPTPKLFVPNERKRKRLFRKVRDASNATLDLDVSAPSIHVFDVPVEDKKSSSQNTKEGEICVSRYFFAVSFAFCLCSLLIFLTGLYLCIRRKARPVKFFPPPY